MHAFVYDGSFTVSDVRVMVRLVVLLLMFFKERHKKKNSEKVPITSFVNSQIFACLTALIFLYRFLAVNVLFLCSMPCCTYGQLKCLIPASLSSCLCSCLGTGDSTQSPDNSVFSVFPAFTHIYIFFSLLIVLFFHFLLVFLMQIYRGAF